MFICTRDQMRDMDRRTIEEVGIAGVVLMEIAGREAAHTIHRVVRERYGGKPKTVAIFCGGGNNGGDGYVMARHLDSLGYDVDVMLVTPPEKIKGDAWTNLEILRRLRPTIIDLTDVLPLITADNINELLPYYDVYVDALLGTGVTSEVRGPYAEVIRYLNEAPRGIKMAVDVPSGVDADTGWPLGIAFNADFTVTFGMAKNGLYLEQGRGYAGDVHVVDIGILPETTDEVGIMGEALTLEWMTRELTYPRPRHAHKGTFGHVGIIAGSRDMSGAAALSAGAALSSGVGLTTVATRESVRPTVLANFPEAMVIPCLPESGPLDDASGEALGAYIEGKSAFAVGPGLGQDEGTAEVLDAVLAQAHSPVVLDADALNVLANDLSVLDNTYCPVILTPHPGEMSRLTNTPVDVGMRAPIEWAFRLAEYTGSYVILKFSTTVICAPDGRYAINTSGNAGMATGGTGDVLTGLLAGLLGSGMTTWDACRLAVFAHGRAGDLAREKVGQRALRAGHLIEFLPGAMAFLESEKLAK